MVKIYEWNCKKKVLIFIAGIVTGAILMLVIALIGNSSNESSNNGMTFL
ncbi:hypothetical protein NXX71_03990 [Bacteroides faecis]|nr:hypothetical protein [Bacteroides faecis]